MNNSEKNERLQWLVTTLNEASKAYYMENTEILSNFEYDKLYDELESLEAELGVILPDSPTMKVGFLFEGSQINENNTADSPLFHIADSLQKVAHEKQILSLDKTKEIEALKSFLGDKLGLLGWKIDGLQIVLLYENGQLVRATTRGNGEIGEDVTHNARHFGGVPSTIEFTGRVFVRGEAAISYSEFNRINENLDEAAKYKNPRNLCSGTVRQLDSKVLGDRRVFFYAFIVEFSDGNDINSKEGALVWAKSQGFTPPEYTMVTAEALEAATLHFKERVQSYDLPTDGLVLTFDDISYSLSLGATSKFPRDSIAFKWEDELARTKLLEISWNTSRTGLINPIAIFEPVELEGTTVERASLHNLSIVRSLELGLGDEITVYKANMIIPQIADNFSRSGTCIVPDKCEACGFKTEIVANGETEFLYCKNPGCKAQLKHTLTHFVSRNAMNIEGLSDATIERFIDCGFLENYLDMFSLHTHKDEIVKMDGFGEKSAVKLIDAVEKSKNCALHSFIFSLGISQIGLANAKLLCGFFDYDFERIMGADEDELLQIDGFGPVMAKSVVDYFDNAENKQTATCAHGLLNIQNPTAPSNSGALSGYTFVITGSLNHFKNRAALSDYIESLGARAASAVSASTTYLINNDATSNSGKNKKAKELGIEIITEEEFVQRFGG